MGNYEQLDHLSFNEKKNDNCGCFTTKAVFNFTRYK